MKIGGVIIAVLLCLASLFAVILIRDHYHEKWLKTNIARVQVGMSENQVVDILGEPTNKHMSDEPGLIWCYGNDTFFDNPEYCGKVSLFMGPGGIVERVSPVIP